MTFGRNLMLPSS